MAYFDKHHASAARNQSEIIHVAPVKTPGHPKSTINMHVSLSPQFTKQLIISPRYKSAVVATDCFDTPSGSRFIVHNKHMSRF